MILKRFYKGEIISIDDPKKLWRIKVDIKGVFSTPNGDEKIDVNELPFIYPMNNGFDSGETPKVGQSVLVEFDGDIRKGRYRSWEEMSEEFLTLLGEDYEGYKSIVHDAEEKLNIRYTRTKGIEIILDKSFIQIEPNGNITHSYNDGERVVVINDKGVSIKSDHIFHGSLDTASEPSVLGLQNETQLNALWDAIIATRTDLKTFATAQAIASVGVLTPLKAGYKALQAQSTDAIPTNKKIKKDVPKTKSKVNKLD